MTDTLTVHACLECQVNWYEGRQPPCGDSLHQHRTFEVHRHRSVVALPDGTCVTAVSFDPREPFDRQQTPDYGLYLDDQWQPPWPHAHLDCPDFGVPDGASAVAALEELLSHARAGEHVEVGCLGGHGRTGTALACLAVLAGISAGEAVDWVRANYCDKAVETPEQEEFVRHMGVRP